MPTPEKFKAPFLPQSFYHIVCKSTDGILLFYSEKDYHVYLERYKNFMGDFIDIWSYALLNNHTHYICKTKTNEQISLFIEKLPEGEKTKSMQQWMKGKEDKQLFDDMLERQMNRFLVSYANYLNNKYERKGAVFQSPFKRIQITDDGYLQQAIIYVHANAQKHGVVEDFIKYTYNSFNSIINNDGYYVDTNAILAFFDGKEKFIKTHEEQVAYFYSKGWASSKLE